MRERRLNAGSPARLQPGIEILPREIMVRTEKAGRTKDQWAIQLTLTDLDWIAKDSQGAFKVLTERAGIVEGSAPQNLPERTMNLCGWTLRVLDEPKPA